MLNVRSEKRYHWLKRMLRRCWLVECITPNTPLESICGQFTLRYTRVNAVSANQRQAKEGEIPDHLINVVLSWKMRFPIYSLCKRYIVFCYVRYWDHLSLYGHMERRAQVWVLGKILEIYLLQVNLLCNCRCMNKLNEYSYNKTHGEYWYWK